MHSTVLHAQHIKATPGGLQHEMNCGHTLAVLRLQMLNFHIENFRKLWVQICLVVELGFELAKLDAFGILTHQQFNC